MHISEQVAAHLVSAGFTASQAPNGDTVYTGTAGTSGGAFDRPVRATLRVDATGRWLESVDGWGNVTRDTDLRNWAGRAAEAVAHVLP